MVKKLFFPAVVLAVMLIGSTSMAANLSELEKFGKDVYMNEKLSLKKNQSCNTCHHKNAAFADPVNANHPTTFPVSEGSNSTKNMPLFGDRNAPSAAYAGFSPIFHWDGELFIGGVFWDGRASGREITDTGQITPDGSNSLSGTLPTYDPMADQAKGPFQNPIEMALPNLSAVVDTVLKDRDLLNTFTNLFPDAFDEDGDVITSVAYNNIAEAIAAFERSSVLNKFSSRFDQFVMEYPGDVSTFGIEVITLGSEVFRNYVGPPVGFTSKYLSQNELIGLSLFNADSAQQLGVDAGPVTNGGMCYLCHLTTPYDTADYDTVEGKLSLVAEGIYPPLFTDFSYDNLGIPVNQTARNLSLASGPDNGLGAQTTLMSYAYGEQYTVNENGKFKVPSLRGVAQSAPYGHNGFFATLTDIVNFYNDREPFYISTGGPEVPENLNESELGNLGMTPADVDAIVAFMKALTDQ